ncbi:MAG TPA: 30S ribosomal protein S12 methylthiotransferase RimO [Polyangia bacterium]|jgi:ribosomal protein S12 methylthiotransferase|nr:30S ribosomal protein S12 methylthiotransferase RimO [Polyangia bacterium]
MNVHFVSLGCPKNRVDTEVMLGHTADAGHSLVAAPEAADVIVVNTCGFIGEAKQESIDAILDMARHKAAGTCKRLVVAGCLSQRYSKELATEMPEVDQFIGTDEVGAIAKAIAGTITRLAVADTPAYLYDDAAPRRRSQAPHSAYIKIAEGCDRPCAFCIIPKLRGPQRSRTPESVVREARDLVAGGTREICLIAQDLTTYGTDLRGVKQTSAGAASATPDDPGAPRLAALLRELGAVDGLGWIRLHYAYPTACTDELLDVIAGEARVASYLDVPIQHVDSGVLKSMRRGYGEKQVRDLVERFRARVPGGTLRTTFIVGHPGETDAGFQRLCDFVREGELDHVGVFNFSREEGTVAALLPKRVPQKDIDARRRELLRIQRQVSKKKLGAMRDRVVRVLVEGASDETEYLSMGRHEGQAPEIDGQVYLSLPPDVATPAPGTFVDARVTHSAEYDLAAELVA